MNFKNPFARRLVPAAAFFILLASLPSCAPREKKSHYGFIREGERDSMIKYQPSRAGDRVVEKRR
jgi:hypothetical protein